MLRRTFVKLALGVCLGIAKVYDLAADAFDEGIDWGNGGAKPEPTPEPKITPEIVQNFTYTTYVWHSSLASSGGYQPKLPTRWVGYDRDSGHWLDDST